MKKEFEIDIDAAFYHKAKMALMVFEQQGGMGTFPKKDFIEVPTEAYLALLKFSVKYYEAAKACGG